MGDSRGPGTATEWRSARALLALRLAIEFTLDVSQVSRGDRDLLDPLILTAILEANQAVVRHDPSLAQVYGDAYTAVPDELRRPISINALAKSLRMPFESVRRRVRVWLQTGVCVQRPDGVFVPQAVVTSPAYVARQIARVERLELFASDLERAGLLQPAGPYARSLADMPRAADRLLGEYMLRTCDRLIGLAEGPVHGVVLLGLCVENLRLAPRLHAMTPEEIAVAARPCTLASLARRTGMPAETVRRHLAALAETGLADRRGRDWVACAQPAQIAPLGDLVVENQNDLRRLFARLGDLQRVVQDGSSRQSA